MLSFISKSNVCVIVIRSVSPTLAMLSKTGLSSAVNIRSRISIRVEPLSIYVIVVVSITATIGVPTTVGTDCNLKSLLYLFVTGGVGCVLSSSSYVVC